MRCLDLLASLVLVGLAVYCSVAFFKDWPFDQMIWLAAGLSFMQASLTVLK